LRGSRQLRYTLIMPAVLSLVYIGTAFERPAAVGRLSRAPDLRSHQLGDEALPMAAPARWCSASSSHRDRALCSSRSSVTGSADARPIVIVMFAPVGVRPVAILPQDVRAMAG
jgi:hypothetical protein